jgi:hypothetical protein
VQSQSKEKACVQILAAIKAALLLRESQGITHRSQRQRVFWGACIIIQNDWLIFWLIDVVVLLLLLLCVQFNGFGLVTIQPDPMGW